MIIKAGKRIFNSDKIYRSYCDFYFGVTFLEHTVYDNMPSILILFQVDHYRPAKLLVAHGALRAPPPV